MALKNIQGMVFVPYKTFFSVIASLILAINCIVSYSAVSEQPYHFLAPLIAIHVPQPLQRSFKIAVVGTGYVGLPMGAICRGPR